MPTCPHCHEQLNGYRNPVPTVDIIIEINEGQEIVLIKRKNPPVGLALPGGFVDYGEKLEIAAVREAEEETGLKVTITRLLGVYSDPARDPRSHTVSTVYVATAEGAPVAGDDAAKVFTIPLEKLSHQPLVFDHADILADYLESLK